MDIQNLLTVDERAEALRVKRSWVYGRTRETGPGALPRIRVGKYLRFDLPTVLTWLKEKQDEK